MYWFSYLLNQSNSWGEKVRGPGFVTEYPPAIFITSFWSYLSVSSKIEGDNEECVTVPVTGAL